MWDPTLVAKHTRKQANELQILFVLKSKACRGSYGARAHGPKTHPETELRLTTDANCLRKGKGSTIEKPGLRSRCWP